MGEDNEPKDLNDDEKDKITKDVIEKYQKGRSQLDGYPSHT